MKTLKIQSFNALLKYDIFVIVIIHLNNLNETEWNVVIKKTQTLLAFFAIKYCHILTSQFSILLVHIPIIISLYPICGIWMTLLIMMFDSNLNLKRYHSHDNFQFYYGDMRWNVIRVINRDDELSDEHKCRDYFVYILNKDKSAYEMIFYGPFMDFFFKERNTKKKHWLIMMMMCCYRISMFNLSRVKHKAMRIWML